MPTIVARAGLTPELVREVLDNCHAAHHISQALAALGLNDRDRLRLGSGAIESIIRRVINLRLKGKGIVWDQANAEAMLHVRALMISKRWDERLAAMRALELRQGRQDWRRAPRPMSIKADPTPTTPQPP